MSLQLLAKQMEAKGRKGDSMLVHMTPDEVEGLQKLAESMGKTLTINPETGLVEANVLKRILKGLLPTAAGLAAGAVGGPMAGAAAGALVGGLTAPKKQREMGLLMGALGGYGGASIGAGLKAAGSTAAQAGAMRTAADTAMANTASNVASATPTAIPSGLVGAGAEGIAGEAAAQQVIAAQQNAAQLALQQEAKAQAIEQARAQAAQDFASKGAFDRIGGGIKALAGQPGRDAFLGQVGMKTAGMAAAPLMLAEERKQADTPADDEMYYYEYNPGRTYAERTPTASSAERVQFAGGYSPGEIIKADEYLKRRNRTQLAAKGGLLSYAEGGEAVADAAPAPSASETALAYLMGERASSSAGLPALAAQAPASPTSNIGIGGDNMYAFDPATGTFLRNPYVAGANSPAVQGRVGTSFAGSGGSDYVDPNPAWTNMSDAEKAAYYAENPTMGAITRGAQTVFGYLPGASAALAAQEYMDPGFAQRQRDITYGIASGSDLSGYSPSAMDTALSDAGYSDYGYSDSAPDMSDFGSSYAGYDSSRGDFASGGITSLAKGGMASGGFVVPADVVSALGNGSTDAGLRKLYAMLGKVKPIKGKGDGLSDSIKTSIDGKQPARVADGEAYIDPKTVKRVGGAKKLYAMMDKIRAQAHGKTSQQRKVNPAKVMA